MPKPSHSRSSSNEPALGSSGGSGSNWESASWKSRNGFMELEEELEEEAVVGNEAVYCEVCEFLAQWAHRVGGPQDRQEGHEKNMKKQAAPVNNNSKSGGLDPTGWWVGGAAAPAHARGDPRRGGRTRVESPMK